MTQYITSSAEETTQLGAALGRTLTGGEVIAFTGGLGAGKTTFCKGLALGLGSSEPVSSPTFSIVNLYSGPIPFAHFDAYRIQNEQDVETAGFYDYQDQGAVVAVEWSENITAFLPQNCIWVDISPISAAQRKITIKGAAGF